MLMFHCSGCNVSAKIFRTYVPLKRVTAIHQQISPKCRRGRIVLRDDVRVAETMKRDLCRNCGHCKLEHAIDRTRCWEGRTLNSTAIIQGAFDPHVCKCPGYRGPKRPKYYYHRNDTYHWWRGSILSGA